MYCSACGHEATIDVNFCKRCGGILGAQTTLQSKPLNLTGASWAMGVTVILMLGIIFSAVVKMAEMGISAVALTWMVIVGLGTVVALVAMIFRQLSRVITLSHQRVPTVALKPPVTSELYQAKPGQLPEPVPSVTEHTTRAFAPARKEPVDRQK